jgi:hypothetical protein
MNLKMNVKDRLVLQSILPQQGSMLTMTIVQEVQDKIKITSDEISKLNMKETKQGITWDAEKKIELELELNDSIKKVLKESAQKADKEEKVTTENLSLIQKLIAL